MVPFGCKYLKFRKSNLWHLFVFEKSTVNIKCLISYTLSKTELSYLKENKRYKMFLFFLVFYHLFNI